jgi:hypothetical protein
MRLSSPFFVQERQAVASDLLRSLSPFFQVFTCSSVPPPNSTVMINVPLLEIPIQLPHRFGKFLSCHGIISERSLQKSFPFTCALPIWLALAE